MLPEQWSFFTGCARVQQLTLHFASALVSRLTSTMSLTLTSYSPLSALDRIQAWLQKTPPTYVILIGHSLSMNTEGLRGSNHLHAHQILNID